MDFVSQFRALFRIFSENELLQMKSSFSHGKFSSENTTVTATDRLKSCGWYNSNNTPENEIMRCGPGAAAAVLLEYSTIMSCCCCVCHTAR